MGEQRGRDLYDINSATHDSRGEAGEIADHAAAKCDDEIVALDLGRQNRIDGALQGGEILGALAGRYCETGRADSCCPERAL